MAAQHTQYVPQIAKRVGGRSAQQADPVGHRPGKVGGPLLEGTGVQGDDREPVGEHIVHLGGDPGAFLQPGLFGAEFALHPQAVDLFGKRGDVPTAVARPQPDDHREQQH